MKFIVLLRLLCELVIIGIGIGVMCAVERLWGMAAIFALMCWKDRPEVLRRNPFGGAA